MRATSRETRWWLSEADDVAIDVQAMVRRVWDDDSYRRTRYERACKLYGPGLHLQRTASSQPMLGALSMNVVRALAQTATSSLLSAPPPRADFLTDGGDYDLQQRAKGMTKLTNAVVQRLGFDAQARGDALLSAVLGTAVTKVFERDGDPYIERVLPWNILVDERDGYDGHPRSLYQIHWVDRAVLAARFGTTLDELGDTDETTPVAQAIRGAGLGGLEDAYDRDTTSDQVCLFEAWHLPSGRKAGDGRHVICTDQGTLVDEEWEDDTFPFAFFHWGAPLTGFWSPGIADEIWSLQLEINLVLLRIREILGKTVTGRTWLEKGSKVTPAPSTNDIAGTAYYTGRPPIIEQTRGVTAELWDYIEYLWSKCFALLGISELSASAMKPAGLDSGKALRVYADLASGRLDGWSRAWHDYYLSVARQLVALLRRGKGSREVTYLDRQRRKLERVAWKEVALQEDEYEIQAFAISSLPTSAAGRMAQLDEWRNAGLIDDDRYFELLDSPDLRADANLATAPRRAVKAACEEMLHGSGRYIPPTSFDNLQTALTLGNLYLVEARVAGVPDDRLALLERYLAEAQALLPPPPAPPGAPPPPDASAPALPAAA